MAENILQPSTELGLSLLIESRLRSTLPPSNLLVKSAWYLFQLYIAAQEYRGSVRYMAAQPQSDSEKLFDEVVRIREIAQTLVSNAVPLAECYEFLDSGNQEDQTGGKDTRAQNLRGTLETQSSDLASVHRQYAKPLCEQLRQAGVAETTSAAFVDDVLDLLWEIESFTRIMGQLIGSTESNTTQSKFVEFLTRIVRSLVGSRAEVSKMLAPSLWEIAHPWLSDGHAMYHLGGRQDHDNNFANPGILGWSLIVLSELTTADMKHTTTEMK